MSAAWAKRLVVACCVMASCGGDSGKSARGDKGAAGAEPSREARRVELARVEKLPLEQLVTISGTLLAQDEVVVRSKVAGKLESVAVDLGTPVKSGQVIAQIETVDYRLRVETAAAALGQAKALLGLSPDDDKSDLVLEETTGVREARATLDEARANFERAKTLVDKKLIGRADYDAAHATLVRAESEVQRAREDVYGKLALLRQRKAELSLARQQLADTTLRAPLDGIVQLRSVSAGELLTQGAAVATVVRIDPLRMRVAVPERESRALALGQKVTLRIDDDVRTYEGKLARLAPALDLQNRTLAVEAEVPNPGHLRPGSFARAVISLGAGEPVLTVPASALVRFAGLEKVIVVQEGKAVEKPVESGRRAGERVEIVKGLEEVASVVLEPGTLQQGQAVVVAGERAGERAFVPQPERAVRVE